MEKRILVLGGAGFIGSHVVDYLVNEGHEVSVVDDLSGGLERNLNRNITFVKASITDHKLMDSLIKDKDIVYHLAAYAAEGLSPFVRRFNYTNNVIGSINLINAAIKNKVKKFVFTSSIAVYGQGNPPFSEEDTPRPDDPYGIAKRTVELDLEDAYKRFGLEHVILRPFNVYGERQFMGDPYRNVLGIFMNRIMQGKTIPIYGDGEQTRAFSYIGDVAPCIARSAFIEKANNQIINIGASKFYSVNQLARITKEAMESDSEIEYLPPRKEVQHAYSKTDKAKRILDFEDITPLEEGIKRMAMWAKNVGPMEPVIWENVEIEEGLPEFYKRLRTEYPNAKNRINPLA
ncbi:NAD-dependent epimerase/dehydratase family protein [Candidatus Pacearchaeota archaeon]|nr:NAD-dependent epimerase/dehydratase family protein [Candidatus Pacearchaeota archaeon]